MMSVTLKSLLAYGARMNYPCLLDKHSRSQTKEGAGKKLEPWEQRDQIQHGNGKNHHTKPSKSIWILKIGMTCDSIPAQGGECGNGGGQI